jgi:thymidylate synthase
MIEADDLNTLFRATLERVLDEGAPVAPRGIPTREISGFQLRLHDCRCRVLNVPGRVINPAFAVAEAVWILLGSDDPWIYDYNGQLRKYAEGGVLRGAYGPRLRRWRSSVDQLEKARRLLIDEPSTRRAVLQIFDPDRDWSGARDVPCTIGHRFLLRDGALQLHTTMRSQDVWLGLPYDLFANSVLLELMAGWAGVRPGLYVHTVDSLHLYDHDELRARCVLDATGESVPSEADEPLAVDFGSLAEMLTAVMSGEGVLLTAGWATWASVLGSYRLWKQGLRPQARSVLPTAGTALGRALAGWYAHLEAANEGRLD